MPSINFRPADDNQHERLAEAAKAAARPLSVEMRAAIDVYLDLLDLAKLREEAATDPEKMSRQQRDDVERAIKDSIGRVMLAAVSSDARHVFEHAAGVEYPVGRIGRIVIPFDKLIDWIATGDVAQTA